MDPELDSQFPTLLSSSVTLGEFLKLSLLVSSLVKWGIIELTLESELSYYSIWKVRVWYLEPINIIK